MSDFDQPHTHPAHRRHAAAALIAVCMAMAACSDDPERQSTSRPSPTTAQTGTSAPRSSTRAPATSATPSETSTTTATTETADPDERVVVAAGDIACSPKHAAFRDGQGTDVECRQKDTADLVEESDPDAVLVLGDLQYERGSLEGFRASYDKSWGRFKKITYPAPGNHEYGTGVAPGYYEYFGERAGDPDKGYYSADIGKWHLVVLNSNCHIIGGCKRGSPQERWLRQDLARNKSRCTIAIAHHPRWSSGLHGDSEKIDGLWRALAEAKVELLLTGHDHDYERFAPMDAAGRPSETGVRQFVVGTGGRNLYFFGLPARGSELRQSSAFGVLELRLRAEDYSWRFVPVPGEDFADEGTGRCH